MTPNNTRNRAHGMNRRTFIKTGTGLSLTAALVTKASAARKKNPPNILLIMTDQQHIDTIAAAGCKYTKTPAMDKLIKRGVNFRQSYSPNPVCSPARSVLFTGRTSTETGVPSNGKSIRSSIPNMGQWLLENTDYETFYAGKWHVPSSYTHFIKGFNVIHTGIAGQGNLGDTGVSLACEGLLRNRDSERPFLMVASFMQPHDICEWLRINTYNPDELMYAELAGELPPLPDNFEYDRREPQYMSGQRQGRDPFVGKWDKQQWRYYRWSYFRHIEMVDGEIGRVLNALEETGLDKNTLIILTSDHGEGLGSHQTVRKSSPYDEAARVPLLVSLPGETLKDHTDDTHLVTSLDIMPTVCDYAGVDTPPKMRGKSLRPLLEGKKTDWHSFIVSEMPSNRGRLLRTARYKYIKYMDDPVELLFDMKKDPGETISLASDQQYESVLKEHRAILRKWESGLDVAPGVPNADYWKSV